MHDVPCMFSVLRLCSTLLSIHFPPYIFPLQFHAEIECPGMRCADESKNAKYQKFLDSRPEVMEVEAIQLVIKLCRQYR